MDVDPEHKPRRERAALSTGLAARLADAQLTRAKTTMHIWPRPMALGSCGCSYVERLDPTACFIEVAWFGLLYSQSQAVVAGFLSTVVYRGYRLG